MNLFRSEEHIQRWLNGRPPGGTFGPAESIQEERSPRREFQAFTTYAGTLPLDTPRLASFVAAIMTNLSKVAPSIPMAPCIAAMSRHGQLP